MKISQLIPKTYYLTSYTISLIKLTRAEVNLDERALQIPLLQKPLKNKQYIYVRGIYEY